MKPQFTPGPYEISTTSSVVEGTVEILQSSDAQQYEPVALVYTAEAFDPSVYTKQEYAELVVECRATARLFKYAPEMFYALDYLAANITDDEAGRMGLREDFMELRKLLERITTETDGE